MADVHSKEVRSFNMSRIKGKNTKPELLVRSFLHAKGLRYRLHKKQLPGKPDLIFPKYKTAVFINGCFWHGHSGCRFFVLPKTKTQWWANKINTNIINDEKKQKDLKNMGWTNIVVWECELKGDKKEETLNSLYRLIIKL